MKNAAAEKKRFKHTEVFLTLS